jgi:hypothetical protein
MSSSIAAHSPGAMPRPFAMALGAIATLARLEASLFFEPTRGNRHVAEARQLAAYLAHVALAMDVADIAGRLGRDVSTVSHACRAVEARRDDPAFDLAVGMIERGLTQLCDVVCREW